MFLCVSEDFVRILQINLTVFPSLDHPSPRSAGKPELAVKCFALAPPSSWACTRAVMAAHADCGHPSPFLLCKASESSCTLLEGGSGLTTAGMTV